METLWQDIRYGIRMLLKSPAFTLVAVLTLALGIGANTAIFSVVNAVLFRSLPYKQPDQLYMLLERTPRFPILSVSYLNYVDWRDQNKVFEAVAATRNLSVTLTGGTEPERLPARMATANFFSMLGVQPVKGRTFLPEEDHAGGTPVALLSYGLWQRDFGGGQDILGKTLTLDSKPYSVVGVLPQDFRYMQPADIYLPFEPWAKTLPDDRSWHQGILPLGRLKAGATPEQARTEMQAIAKRLEEQYSTYNTGVTANVVRLSDQIVQNVRSGLLILLGAVSLVLLIACANVANLLLARATGRQREIAIRQALGAGRGRLIRQLLTESVLLSLAGASLAILIASWCVGPLLQLSGTVIPRSEGIGIDLAVLGFTAGIALLTGLFFGLAPALHATRMDLREKLNVSGRSGAGGVHHQQLRAALVISEVALAMVLLVGAGLLIRSLERLQDVPPGFQPDHLLVADIPLSATVYPKTAQRTEFFDQLLARAETLPGVRSAGAATVLPLAGNGAIIHFNIQGRPPKDAHEFIMAGYRAVSAKYFQTLGMPLLQGRFFTDADAAKSPAVVVINTTMAHQFFPNQSPLGQHIQLGATPEKEVAWMEVVGMVGDVKTDLALGPQAEMYIPYAQADEFLPVLQLSVVMRTGGDPKSLASALRSAVYEINKKQPIVKVRTMEENLSDSIAQPRFRTVLLGIFAGLALLLTTVGVYGVLSYTVTQRTQEIGIRMALGAQSSDVLRLIIGQGMKLTLVAVGIGLAGALGLGLLMRTMLFGVTFYDPATFLGTAILLTGVALAACYVPARRAMRVDPLVALRYE
jgi:putative ABC transport system permease protein